jgi:hypothetical protein
VIEAPLWTGVDTDRPVGGERGYVSTGTIKGLGRVSVAASGISTVLGSTCTVYGTRTRKMDD